MNTQLRLHYVVLGILLLLLPKLVRTATDSPPSGLSSTSATTSEDVTGDSTDEVVTSAIPTESTGSLNNDTDISSNDTATNSTSEPPEEIISYRSFPEFPVAYFISEYHNYFTNIPGIVGNLLTILTAIRMKPYTATSICIIVLAVTDFSMCLMRCGYNYVPVKYHLNFFCRSKNFLLAFFSIFSNYILVVWTIERFIAVAFPMKLQVWCTIRNTKIVLAGSCLFSFLFSLVYIIDVSSETIVLDDNDTITRCRLGEFLLDIYGYIDFVIYVLIPMAIILICNSLIVFIMSKRRKAHATMTNNVDQQDKRIAEQRRMTYILLSVTLAFLIFHTPYVVKTSYDFVFFLEPLKYGPHFYVKYWLMSWVAVAWLQMQNTVNFIVYCLSGPRFRKEFINLICFFRRAPKKRDRVANKDSSKITEISTVSSK